VRLTEAIHFVNNKITQEYMRHHYTHFIPTDDDKRAKESRKKRKEKKIEVMELF